MNGRVVVQRDCKRECMSEHDDSVNEFWGGASGNGVAKKVVEEVLIIN